MGYQVLARKWRPRFFDEMVGQEHVLRALIHALDDQRLHHAYLFTGTRGVGKTTIARILAMCLNCEEGVSSRPCGTCSSCREIVEGRFVDLIEVDAASRTKVEDTRELLDNVQYAPTRGRFKVYLIDEVHMLSTHSFNALLKTLEEPPEHVKFLLATTDPQKLPVTILSRCLQFGLKNMTAEKIVSHLQTVLQAEHVDYQEPALWQLGRAAQGSMRDALSLADQAIAYGRGCVHEEQVNAMLGTLDRGRVFRLIEVMAKGDASGVLQEVQHMSEHAPDYDEVLQALLRVWHRVAIAQISPDAIDNTEGDRDAILSVAAAMTGEDVQLYYQIGIAGRSDLALASDAQQGFEMVLLRMLAFRPAPVAPLSLSLDSCLDAQSGSPVESDEQKKKPSLAPNAAPAASQESVQQESVEQEPVTPEVMTQEAHVRDAGFHDADVQEVSAQKADLARPAALNNIIADIASTDITSKENEPQEQGSAAFMAPEPQPSPLENVPARAVEATAEAVTDTTVDTAAETAEPEAANNADAPLEPIAAHNWHEWLAQLPLAGMTLSIANHSALVSVDGDVLNFDVDPAQSALFNDSHQHRIESALRPRLPNVKVVMTLQQPRGETPAQRQTRLDTTAKNAAKASLEGDPALQTLLKHFDGVVLEDSIQAIK